MSTLTHTVKLKVVGFTVTIESNGESKAEFEPLPGPPLYLTVSEDPKSPNATLSVSSDLFIKTDVGEKSSKRLFSYKKADTEQYLTNAQGLTSTPLTTNGGGTYYERGRTVEGTNNHEIKSSVSGVHHHFAVASIPPQVGQEVLVVKKTEGINWALVFDEVKTD